MDHVPLLPAPAELLLSHLAVDTTGLTVVARTRRPEVACPRCGALTRRVHSAYTRALADLPWHGLAVRLVVTTRRFFCDQPGCSQCIFTERLPRTAVPSARRTTRLAAALDRIGLALGGAAGARLAERLGMRVSGDTVRRLVVRQRDGGVRGPTPRVLGVDEWAWRRGHRYGTLLIDLERRCVVDLLPDRAPETLAAWLKAHAGVEVISRDRAGIYAEGARAGAPDAVQVADRFHLLRNLGEAVQRAVVRHGAVVRAVATTQEQPPTVPREAARRRRISGLPHNSGGPTQAEQIIGAHRARRLAQYEEVVALRGQGVSHSRIARAVGLDRGTIMRWLAADQFPERRPRPPKPRLLDPYCAVILARYQAGLDNATELYRELRALGYRGAVGMVRQEVLALRQTRPRTDPTGPPGPRRALLRDRPAGSSARRLSNSATPSGCTSTR